MTDMNKINFEALDEKKLYVMAHDVKELLQRKLEEKISGAHGPKALARVLNRFITEVEYDPRNKAARLGLLETLTVYEDLRWGYHIMMPSTDAVKDGIEYVMKNPASQYAVPVIKTTSEGEEVASEVVYYPLNLAPYRRKKQPLVTLISKVVNVTELKEAMNANTVR